jgi:hypothetical protein
MDIVEFETIDKNNLRRIADYFYENRSVEELTTVADIIDDNGYGTLFLAFKADKKIKFSIHIGGSNPFNFSSIIFGRTNLTIEELIELYPLYKKGYIIYDEEFGYSFRPFDRLYTIEAYIDGNCSQEALMLPNLNRLIIRW